MQTGDFWYGVGQAAGYVVSGWAAAIVSYWYGKKRKKRSSHDSVEQITAQSLRIRELVTELRVKTCAARAYVVKVGNSEEYIDGKAILKKKRICEVCALEVVPQSAVFENMPIARVPDEMALVEQKGPSWTLVDNLPHGEFKWLCQMGGAVAIARLAIRRKGELVGFVGMDFTSNIQPDNLDVAVSYAERLEWMI